MFIFIFIILETKVIIAIDSLWILGELLSELKLKVFDKSKGIILPALLIKL